MDQPRMAGAARLRAGFARAEVVDSRVRIRRLMFFLAAALVVILARLGWLQLNEGPEFRRLAAQPIERHRRLDGVRGRILTRDGVVLAEDRPVLSVAVDYRWIADPPDAAWLRRVARQRLVRAKLPLAARRDPARLQIEIENVRDERLALQRRLAALCECDAATWESRLEAIRRKVSAAAAEVNARRQAQFRAEQQRSAALAAQATSGWERFRAAAQRILFPVEAASPPPPIKIAEEVSDQIVAVGVPLDVVAEIEARPELYPATRIVQQSRRFYPGGMRAAHVVGHLGPATTDELRANHAAALSTGARLNPGDYVGRAGVEALYDKQLRGRNGRERELSDLTGRVLSRECLEQPTAGRDLILTIDARLQQTAEALLEAALARRDLVTGGKDDFPAAGGSIVALDVRTGGVLAAASAPAFDPGLFQPGGERLLSACLTDPRAPLLDRSIQMALPPGSVFKIVTAAALLAEGRVAPQRPFDCAGYFENPERERCAIFARYGEGHGPVTLETALVQSCNVYFFAQAGQLGAKNLLDWAARLGLGQPTGIDLPAETPGHLPAASALSRPTGPVVLRERELRAAAVGQSTLTATPLQIARLLAAVANRGTLVVPHVVAGWGLPSDPRAASGAPPVPPLARTRTNGTKIAELDTATLEVLHRALRGVVDDSAGTGHASVHLEGLSIAGKTGTAEAGGNRPAHAWFAGYAPAESPRVAFVVALEHAGSAGEAAGPVARRLVQRLDQLGYLGRGHVMQAGHSARSEQTR